MYGRSMWHRCMLKCLAAARNVVCSTVGLEPVSDACRPHDDMIQSSIIQHDEYRSHTINASSNDEF